MGSVFAAVEHWVAQTAYFVGHIQFRTDAEVRRLAAEHIFEVLQVLLDCVLAVLRLDHFFALFFHLKRRSVICVGVAVLNELTAVVLDLFKVVRTERHFVRHNLKSLEISYDVLNKLDLLSCWVRVIKAQNHRALVHLCVVIVEHRGFYVADV